MGFRFSLETVLRLRRSLEDGERLRLQALLVNRVQLQAEIAETNASRAALATKLKASLSHDMVPGGEMQFTAQRARASDLQSVRLNAALSTLTQQIQRQQSALLRRRIDRKVLEQLRERQVARYDAETQRRAQSQLEELFLLRRTRERDRKPEVGSV